MNTELMLLVYNLLFSTLDKSFTKALTDLENFLNSESGENLQQEINQILYLAHCLNSDLSEKIKVMSTEFKFHDASISFLEDTKILESFNNINQNYHFFDEKNTIISEKYIKIYKLFQFLKSVFPDFIKDQDLYFLAYSVLVCFADSNNKNQNVIKKLDEFLKAKTISLDTFLTKIKKIELPKLENSQQIDLTAWQKEIFRYGLKGLDLFTGMTQSNMIFQNPEIAKLGQIRKKYQPKDNAELEVAKVFFAYDIDPNVFKWYQEFKKAGKLNPKTQDNIPHIYIDGKNIVVNEKTGRTAQGYHFLKIPLNDPRRFFLGKITDCCQTLMGAGEQNILSGITSPNSDYYVLFRALNQTSKNKSLFLPDGSIDYTNFEIVGLGYCWRTVNYQLVFNSWNNLRDSDDKIIVPILHEFAGQAIEKHEISKVCIGVSGGKSPEYFKNQPKIIHRDRIAPNAESMGNAHAQVLIAEHPLFQEPELCLNDMLPAYMSINQLKIWLNFLKTRQIPSDSGQELLKHLIPLVFWICYKKEYCTLKDLKGLSLDEIKALTSAEALECYKGGSLIFEDLKDLSSDKINALLSPHALACYKKRYLKFEDLKDLSLDKINILTSPDALACYKKGLKFKNVEFISEPIEINHAFIQFLNSKQLPTPPPPKQPSDSSLDYDLMHRLLLYYPETTQETTQNSNSIKKRDLEYYRF